MSKENKRIVDLNTDDVSGGALTAANAKLADFFIVMESLDGKTCKFCKKKFNKEAVWASYSLYKSRVLRQFESFGCAAVPCLYCDYWRKTTDFE